MLRLSILFLSFIFFTNLSNGQKHLDSTLAFILENHSDYGWTVEDVREALVKDNYTSRHSSVEHIYLQQTINGIPIENAISNINVSREGKILNVNSRFIPLSNAFIQNKKSISNEEALDIILNDLKISDRPEKIKENLYAPLKNSLENIKSDLSYIYLEKKGFFLAWKFEVETHKNGFHFYNYFIDAKTGKILKKEDQVLHCSFGNKKGNCNIKKCGSHHKENKISYPEKKSFFNPDSYLVFPLRVESPNHGERETLINPADATASPYGWHDDNGFAGAEYTFTQGNNVLAQEDFDGQNGDGYRPDGGTNLDFIFPQNLDFPPDTNLTDAENLNASITNLFVCNNLMHDVWYHYGFDEVSGNMQINNYGKGGVGNDHVLADAQDGSGENNATFFPGSEGQKGRMQMYMWTELAAETSFTINSPSDISGDYMARSANFGGLNYDITAELFLMDDNSENPTFGCVPNMDYPDITGKIALIDRGGCQFGSKALFAQDAGAVAVVFCNNEPGTGVYLAPGFDGDGVTIPMVMLGQKECDTIKMNMPGVEVTMNGFSNGHFKDGSLDNGIISHEYGHGISIRLTGGSSSSNCLNNEEQAGEGWSDFFGLVMTQKLTDNRFTPRGIGTYATSAPVTDDGIRRHPYTTDMSINPLTYDDLKIEFTVHGIGAVMASTLWDLYWDLIDVHGFDPDLYNGTGGNNIAMQLVIDGLKLQPCQPGFMDVRDAIILADEINNNGENYCLIWQTFARRGMGYSAEQGSPNNKDDGNEAFDLPPDVEGLGVVKSADKSAGEAGDVINYYLSFENKCNNLNQVEIRDLFPGDVSPIPNSISDNGFINSNQIKWPDLNNMNIDTTFDYTYQVAINPDVESFFSEPFADDMENGEGVWEIGNTTELSNWVLIEDWGDYVWHAEELEADPRRSENQFLMTPDIFLDGVADLFFTHRFDTEPNWDGGKVEISLDDGGRWFDLKDHFIENGYNNFITNSPNNPAFSGNSEGYINSRIDLSAFCGETVRIRFNFYYDQLAAGNGWYVDDVKIRMTPALINEVEVIADGVRNSDKHCVRIKGFAVTDENIVQENFEVDIFPNPNSESEFYLQISGNESIGKLEYGIFDISGRLIYQGSRMVSDTSEILKIDDLNIMPGIYSIQIKTDDFSAVRKWVRI